MALGPVHVKCTLNFMFPSPGRTQCNFEFLNGSGYVESSARIPRSRVISYGECQQPSIQGPSIRTRSTVLDIKMRRKDTVSLKTRQSCRAQ